MTPTRRQFLKTSLATGSLVSWGLTVPAFLSRTAGVARALYVQHEPAWSPEIHHRYQPGDNGPRDRAAHRAGREQSGVAPTAGEPEEEQHDRRRHRVHEDHRRLPDIGGRGRRRMQQMSMGRQRPDQFAAGRRCHGELRATREEPRSLGGGGCGHG